jgi:phosphohistidine phosphatase SixA
MNLYLIRHGDSETDKPDEERALTTLGRENVSKVAQWVTQISEAPSMIFSSPLKRALETAEPFAKAWNKKIEMAQWLRSEIQPSEILKELSGLPSQSFALVGHLPSLGLLFGTLVWGLPSKEVIVPKGGVVLLNLEKFEPGSAKLKWMVCADLLD